jgi:hypothetical protein
VPRGVLLQRGRDVRLHRRPALRAAVHLGHRARPGALQRGAHFVCLLLAHAEVGRGGHLIAIDLDNVGVELHGKASVPVALLHNFQQQRHSTQEPD